MGGWASHSQNFSVATRIQVTSVDRELSSLHLLFLFFDLFVSLHTLSARGPLLGPLLLLLLFLFWMEFCPLTLPPQPLALGWFICTGGNPFFRKPALPDPPHLQALPQLCVPFLGPDHTGSLNTSMCPPSFLSPPFLSFRKHRLQAASRVKAEDTEEENSKGSSSYSESKSEFSQWPPRPALTAYCI